MTSKQMTILTMALMALGGFILGTITGHAGCKANTPPCPDCEPCLSLPTCTAIETNNIELRQTIHELRDDLEHCLAKQVDRVVNLKVR